MGLEENESSTPLAAPRQEMLKEVFVSGCQAPRVTREDREALGRVAAGVVSRDRGRPARHNSAARSMRSNSVTTARRKGKPSTPAHTRSTCGASGKPRSRNCCRSGAADPDGGDDGGDPSAARPTNSSLPDRASWSDPELRTVASRDPAEAAGDSASSTPTLRPVPGSARRRP